MGNSEGSKKKKTESKSSSKASTSMLPARKSLKSAQKVFCTLARIRNHPKEVQGPTTKIARKRS
jgi:hypothetical protein